MAQRDSSVDQDQHRSVQTVDPRTLHTDEGDDAEPVYTRSSAANPASLVQRLVPNNRHAQDLVLGYFRSSEYPRIEIEDNALPLFNASTGNPSSAYTCGLYLENKSSYCLQGYTRRDRFKYHLHAHLGLTPYPARNGNQDRWYTSPNARDIAEKNQEKTPCLHCGAAILPKNFRRHEATIKCRNARSNIE